MFVSRRDGASDLMIHTDRGTENVTNSSSEDIMPSWSPDGTEITFVSDRTGAFRLYVLTLETGVVRCVARPD